MRPLRIMIVDDSAVVRGLISKMLEETGGIEVVGTASNGERALAYLKQREVDVMILDYEMPVLDGLETAAQIRQLYPEVETIFISAKSRLAASSNSGVSIGHHVQWLEKPVASSAAESMRQLQGQLLGALKAIRQHRIAGGQPVAETKQNPVASKPAKLITRTEVYRGHPKILVIGSSTGGPQALNAVLCALPAQFDLPILITQHMPPKFTASLAKHLARDTGRDIREGEAGERIKRSRVYIAPGDFHMTVDKHDNAMCIGLNQDPPEHHCRPSVNPMFRTAAHWYGTSVMGLMLTGMGEDGIEGTHDLVNSGGYMLIQNEETSVVWGMPGAVAREGLAHDIYPLDRIAMKLSQVANVLEQKV